METAHVRRRIVISWNGAEVGGLETKAGSGAVLCGVGYVLRQGDFVETPSPPILDPVHQTSHEVDTEAAVAPLFRHLNEVRGRVLFGIKGLPVVSDEHRHPRTRDVDGDCDPVRFVPLAGVLDNIRTRLVDGEPEFVDVRLGQLSLSGVLLHEAPDLTQVPRAAGDRHMVGLVSHGSPD